MLTSCFFGITLDWDRLLGLSWASGQILEYTVVIYQLLLLCQHISTVIFTLFPLYVFNCYLKCITNNSKRIKILGLTCKKALARVIISHIIFLIHSCYIRHEGGIARVRMDTSQIVIPDTIQIQDKVTLKMTWTES